MNGSDPSCASSTAPVAEDVLLALARAVDLVDGAAAGVRAAGDVEWRARAAELYRAAVADAARALARDRVLLDGAVRLAYGGWAR
ncbi:hypothetical protein [Promicromonospora sp. MEB111]|uniref:hypothetical protein n=1 Tax=unclassified Promicromonospora TaxID=2647929 RepID=UPI00254AAD48|nr:hypothetical protein [Promicromonospora sp. MEB111]